MSFLKFVAPVRWVLLCIGLTIGASTLTTSNHRGPVIELEMASLGQGLGQIFWASGSRDYAEAASAQFEVIHDGALQRYSILLPADRQISRLRLDPSTAPGSIEVASASMACNGQLFKTAPEDLQPTHDLIPVTSSSTTGARFTATGADPHLELALPEAFVQCTRSAAKRQGWLILAGMLIGLALIPIPALSRAASGDLRSPPPLIPLALSLILILCVLALLRLPPVFSMDAVRLGFPLLGAALLIAAPGSLLIRRLPWLSGGHASLFASVAAGQVLLVSLVSARAALGRVAGLPMSAVELWLVCGVAVIALVSSLRAPDAWRQWQIGNSWRWLELGALAAVCFWVAGRELPREVMLSSDPDTYAFLARVLQLTGGIPGSPDEAFGFPAGSAVLGWIWASLAGLDIRDSVSALPTLQWMLAALLIASLGARFDPSQWRGLTLQLACTGFLAAGLLLPLYPKYALMQGTARQMAISTLALLMAIATMRWKDHGLRLDCISGVLIGCCLATLGLLNPSTLIFPMLVGVAWVLTALALRKSVGIGALLAVGFMLLIFTDPWYLALLQRGAEHGQRLGVNLPALTPAEIWERWSSHWWHLLKQAAKWFTRILPEQKFPFFLVGTGILISTALLAGSRLRMSRLAIWFGCFLISAILFTTMILEAVRIDRRLYLLAEYFQVGLAQAKTVVMLLLLTWTMLALLKRFSLAGGVLIGAIFVASTAWLITPHLAIERTPRAKICGGLGCVHPDDIAVLEAAEKMHRNGLLHGKVLLPNASYHSGLEQWIFPVGASRAVPFMDLPPPAFFYFQGDRDYTVEAYQAHVCDRLDREWLKAQEINYIFIPHERLDACIKEMDELAQTDIVLAKTGKSQFIQIR